MSRVKSLTVLRTNLIKDPDLISEALGVDGAGMLFTFSAESSGKMNKAISGLSAQVMLDNGAFISRREQEVLEAKKGNSISDYAALISNSNVGWFIEPDIVAPSDVAGALSVCVSKANLLYKFLSEDCRGKAIRPIQGQSVSVHMKWFRGYRPISNPMAPYVAFGGLGEYKTDLPREILSTTKILAKNYDVKRIHLLGSESQMILNLTEELLEHVDGVSFDSNTAGVNAYHGGNIRVLIRREMHWVSFRRRQDPFSKKIRDALNDCPCRICDEVRKRFDVFGFANLIENKFLQKDVSGEIMGLIILHNAAIFGIFINLRFARF